MIEIYDKNSAKATGIYLKNKISVMVHYGSCGLEHQIAIDYI
jgi:RNA-splicing ligase RtcB